MELEIVIVVCSSQESVSKPNFDKNFNSKFVLISRPQADYTSCRCVLMHSHCPQGWPHGLNHAVRMLGDEGFPRFGTVGLDGLLALIEVAQRGGEGIGSVE